MNNASLVLGAVALAVAQIAAAADATTYPSRPVRLIVGAAASPPDTVARIIAEPISAALGKPVIVDNRPSANGTVSTDAIAKAPPDGHTIGFVGLPQMVAPSIMPELPYDLLRDLAPVTQLYWSANVVVVRPGSPLQTMAAWSQPQRRNRAG